MNHQQEKKPLLKLGSLTLTECSLLILIACLLFIIKMNFQFLPVHDLFAHNSDGLFIEDVARNLNNGGDTMDWRLTQAPYLFPDVFGARLLLMFNIAIGKVAVYYQVIFGGMLCLLMGCITRAMNARIVFPVLSCAALYATSYIGGLFGDNIALYFGLLGFHSGIAITLLAAILFSIYYFKKSCHPGLVLIGLFTATFLGVISDSLVALALVPFSGLFVLICLINKETSIAEAGRYIVTLLAAVAVGKLYGYTVPFPQDREFMAYLIAGLPDSAYVSLKLFPKIFVQAATESRLSLAIFIAYALSIIIALRYLIYAFKTEKKLYEPYAFLSFFILLTPPLAVATQIGLGVFVSIDSSRQWAPTIFMAIIFGNILAAEKYNVLGKLLQAAYIGGTALLLVYTAKALSTNNGRVVTPNPFVTLADCMTSENLPQGNLYASDYWVARPTRMYSGEKYGISSFDANLAPVTNASNIKLARQATPEFIITGYSISREDIAKRFGAPLRSICKMSIYNRPIEILDYSNNADVKALLRAAAVRTY